MSEDGLYTACPYCWQPQEVLEDLPAMNFIEIVQDCTVCCNPILFEIRKINHEYQIEAKKEND